MLLKNLVVIKCKQKATTKRRFLANLSFTKDNVRCLLFDRKGEFCECGSNKTPGDMFINYT